MLVGILVDGVAGLQLAVGCPRTVCASVRRLGAVAMSEAADSDLWASLRARMETTEAPPLGVDEVGADCMGPQDVVAYIMKSMSAGDLNAILGMPLTVALAAGVRLSGECTVRRFLGQVRRGA